MYYNYLLFVPSLLSKNDLIKYKIVIEDVNEEEYPEYEGIQTNEAMTKFLIDYLKKSDGSLNKIIMLCTEEVRRNRIPEVGDMTTLEFYKQRIKQFLQEKEQEVEDLFEVVTYVPQNNENENQIMMALEKIIQPFEESKVKKRVYVDFTGGSRSAALTLVFASRILDKSNVEVAKILYSNLKRKNGELVGSIEECTRTYRIFSELERQLMITNELVIKEDSDIKSIIEKQLEKTYSDMIKASRTNQAKKVQEKKKLAEELLTQIDISKMSYSERKTLVALQKKIEELLKEIENPLLSIKNHLKMERYDKALADFREKIGNILLQAKIIEVKEQYKENGGLKNDLAINEIAAVYDYYENNKNKSTYMKMIQEYIEKLCENPEKSPKEIQEEFFDEYYFSLERYLDKIPKHGFKHSSFSRKKCDSHVIAYLEKFQKDGNDLRTCLQKYAELDRLYMGYGFPFGCTYGGSYYYDGYDKAYKNNFKYGVESLQKCFIGEGDRKIDRMCALYPEEKFTYVTLIEKLRDVNNKEMLYILFPYQLLKSGISKGQADCRNWSEFMHRFAKTYCIVKSVRNKSTHPKEMEKGEMKLAIEEMTKLIAEIECIRKGGAKDE